MRLAIAGALMPAALTAAAGVAEIEDTSRGERAFQKCYACHSVDPGETARLQGPSLYRILDRPAALFADFEYSPAMRQKAAAGLVWSTDNLDRYIADPDAVVPNTPMSAPPIQDARERADLIAYLARSGRFVP